jgi:hypothetical protein
MGLLLSAAELLDRRDVTLGPGQEAAHSAEAEIVRLFAQDRAELRRPIMSRLDLPDANVARRNTPVAREELTRGFRYYWLEFPVSLWTCAGRAFNSLQIAVTFNADDDEARRPIAFDALPDQAFAIRFKAESQVALGVDAAFKFSAAPLAEAIGAALPGVSVIAHAGAGVEANTKLIFGPFRCTLRTLTVKRTAIGLPEMVWRLDESSFEDENDPGLRVILRVPDSVDHLQIGGAMEAKRYFNLLDAGLKGAMRDLPKAVASFFTGGTPITTSASWNLSARL